MEGFFIYKKYSIQTFFRKNKAEEVKYVHITQLVPLGGGYFLKIKKENLFKGKFF